MMRKLVYFPLLVSALVAAHALLAGWIPGAISDWPLLVRSGLAVGLLGLAVRGFARAGIGKAIGRGCADDGCRPPIKVSRKTRRHWLEVFSACVVWIAIHAIFLWVLTAGAPVIERIGMLVEPWLHADGTVKRKEASGDANSENRSGNWLWHDHRSRALPVRTDLRLNNRPEVFLRFATPEDAAAVVGSSAYLGSFALSKFDDGIWTTPGYERKRIEISKEGWTSLAIRPPESTGRLIGHEVFHGKNAAGQDMLIALQGVEGVGIGPLESHGDGFIMLPDAEEDAIGFRYRASSRPVTLADLPGNLAVLPSSDVEGYLLEIPDLPRIATHLREQTTEIVGEVPDIDSLKLLETWLHEAFDYSLVTANPENLDPLENFLFAERRGHCEHFAMTAALMLRSIGIPTRIAYGWAGGTWYASQELMVFRSQEAHAWAEVWLDGFGWVVMDPTPPNDMINSRSRIAPPDETPPDPAVEFADDSAVEDAVRVDLAALWLLGICGFSAVVTLWLRRRMAGSRQRDGSGPSSPSASCGYLDLWLSTFPPRYPGETIRQQMKRRQNQPPFSVELLDYHYRIRYNEADRNPATESELVRAIRKWIKQKDPAE